MKSIALCVLTLAGGAGAAAAQVSYPGQLETYDLPSSLKFAGPPEITVGPVAKNQVFYRRKVTYARTGALKSAMMLKGHQGQITLPAGAPMFAISTGKSAFIEGPVIWCTIAQPGVKQVCLLHDGAKPIWITQDVDVTFTARVALRLPEDTAPEPEIDETTPPPATDFAVEIGLGDTDAINKENDPALSGKVISDGFVGPPVYAMAISHRYLDHGVEQAADSSLYETPNDVALDGATLHYDAATGGFVAVAR